MSIANSQFTCQDQKLHCALIYIDFSRNKHHSVAHVAKRIVYIGQTKTQKTDLQLQRTPAVMTGAPDLSDGCVKSSPNALERVLLPLRRWVARMAVRW